MSVFFYLNKSHRDIRREQAVSQFQSNDLLSLFIYDEVLASKHYLDQTIEVKGIVTEIKYKFLTLDDKIYCKFVDTIPQNLLYTNLKVKGRCIGFDELLEQIKLDQCTLQNQF